MALLILEATCFAHVLTLISFECIVCLANVVAYFLVGFRREFIPFSIFIAALWLLTVIGIFIGFTMGAVARDVPRALAFAMPVLTPILLFSGFAIPFQAIPPGWIWAYYLSMYQYTVSIMQINEFAPRTLDGQSGKAFLAAQGLSGDQLGRDFGILILLSAALGLLAFLTLTRKP